MPYTLDEISRTIAPIAKKYNLKSVWVFGSYARGEATDDSDVDLIVDLDGCTARGWHVYGMMDEISCAFANGADIVTEASISQPAKYPGEKSFRAAAAKERVKVYGSVA